MKRLSINQFCAHRCAENCMLSLFFTAANVLLMGICFDFYYDLNDDAMMLDIMSGAYSGIPDGHNMQTLYPLGALLALCYRLCTAIPWYGLFLCLCQFGCFFLVAVRLCALTGKVWRLDTNEKCRKSDTVKKVSVLLALSLFVWGVCLAHLVNIQYTVTSAVLSAAAVFLFLTAPETDGIKQFIINNIPPVLLAVTAYQLRSEMLLLTFPFICLAGLYRLTGERKIFAKENLFQYGGVLGIMLAGMLISRGADYAAYSSEEWKDFLRFFEARTTVYDFYPELVTDEEYGGTLTELGVAPYQQALLRNYNYGLDAGIDTKLLTEVADYAADTLRAAKDWGAIVREQVYRYYYRTFRGGDSPYSAMLLWMYGAVLAVGFCTRFEQGQETSPGAVPEKAELKIVRRTGFKTDGPLLYRFDFVWQIMLLAAARSAVWMFILLRGRDPARITHSLYLVEFALLAGMAVRILGRGRDGGAVLPDAPCPAAGRPRRCVLRFLGLVFFLIIGGGVTDGVSALQADQEWREFVNGNRIAIDEYCKAHDENFYFEDVYSTVSFSRRMFDDVDHSYANYDILGGWMCGSPLYYEKIGRYGIESVQRALVGQDNVYLIMSDLEVTEQGFQWIEDYYAAQGISVAVEKTDTVGEGYSVYQVVRSKEMKLLGGSSGMVHRLSVLLEAAWREV